MYSRFLQQTSLVLAGNGLSKILLVFFEVAFALRWGPGRYGIFALCLAMLMALGSLAVSGFGFAIVRYLAIYQEEEDSARCRALVQSGLASVAIVGSFLGALLFFFAGAVAEHVFGKTSAAAPMAIFALAVPLEAVNQFLGSTFRGLRLFGKHVLVSDLFRNAWLVLSLPFAVMFDLSLQSIGAGLVAGTALASFYGALQLARLGLLNGVAWSKRWSAWQQLMSFSYLLAIWNVIQQLASRVPLLLGGVFLDVDELGILGLLLRSTLLFMFVQTGFIQTASVEFAKLSHLNRFAELRMGYAQIAEVLALVGVWIAIPLLVMPEVLLGFFGAEYVGYGALLFPLVVSQIVNVGTGPAVPLLINSGHQRAVFVISVTGSALQILLGFWLISAYGLTGAVTSVTITVLIIMLMRQLLAFRLVSFHGFSWTLLAFLVAGALSVALGQVVAGSDQTLDTFALAVGTAYAACFSLLAGYAVLDSSFRSRFLALVKFVTGRTSFQTWQGRLGD